MMRAFIYVVVFLGLLGLGTWAYSENYDMRARASEVSKLQREIGTLRDAISTQKAEWAYLNRPDRLRELVDLNFDQLALMPMDAAQLGRAAWVAYPAPDAETSLPADLDLSDSVTISGVLSGDVEETRP
mgnify:CR=1 FL=1|jgi:hypothetical protein